MRAKQLSSVAFLCADVSEACRVKVASNMLQGCRAAWHTLWMYDEYDSKLCVCSCRWHSCCTRRYYCWVYTPMGTLSTSTSYAGARRPPSCSAYVQCLHSTCIHQSRAVGACLPRASLPRQHAMISTQLHKLEVQEVLTARSAGSKVQCTLSRIRLVLQHLTKLQQTLVTPSWTTRCQIVLN